MDTVRYGLFSLCLRFRWVLQKRTRDHVLGDHAAADGGTGARYNVGMPEAQPLVGIVMGSRSDWDTMRGVDEIVGRFGVPHECRVVSAHRTPDWMAEYASTAISRGLEVIVAGAGGAAHLPGMVAAHTVLPVIGVPVQTSALNGLDSLLSIVQMPRGVPVATVAIGASGAVNAGLLAVAILATSRPELRARLEAYRSEMAAAVRSVSLP